MSDIDITARALAVQASNQVSDWGSVLDNGAKGDGVTDDLDALQAFISDGGYIHFPPGDYLISGPIHVGSDTHVVMSRGARLMPTAGSPTMLVVRGSLPTSWTALTADLEKGSKTFSHASDEFSVGDWLEFRSDAPIPGPNALGGRLACVRRIIKKSGTGPYTYTVNKTVQDGYLLTDAAICGRAYMHENVTLEGLAVNSEDYTTLAGFGLMLEYCANVRILNPTIIGSKPRSGADMSAFDGIKISRGTFDIAVTGADLRHIGWYGVSIGGSAEQITISGGKVEDARHAVSVVWNDAYGEPVDVLVDGMVATNTTLSGFDTHDTGRNIRFDNCVSIGAGDCGFQLRSRGVRITGGFARDSALDGIKIVAGATDCVLQGCRVETSGRIGYNLGEQARMIDCDASDHVGPISGYCAIQFANGGEVTGGKFRRNASGVIRVISGDAVHVERIDAPADPSQTIFMAARTSLGGRFNRVTVKNCRIPGYAYNAVFSREQAARPPGDLPPITSGNLVSDGGPGAEWRGETTLVGGAATVSTSAVRHVTDANWTEDIVSKIDIRRTAAGGTIGQLHVESIANGSGFVIRSTSANDASTVQWSVEL